MLFVAELLRYEIKSIYTHILNVVGNISRFNVIFFTCIAAKIVEFAA